MIGERFGIQIERLSRENAGLLEELKTANNTIARCNVLLGEEEDMVDWLIGQLRDPAIKSRADIRAQHSFKR